MTITPNLLIKVALAIVAVVFTGFGTDNLFPAAQLEDDLLIMAAVGFGLGAIIFP